MEWDIRYIDETDSTNRWLREHGGMEDMVVVADYQTAGRGCGTNTWESERGQNLLFSILLHPKSIPASRQFHISMAISLAICEALGQQIGDLSIKWPNDIYWRNAKIAGILIENTLKGTVIKDCIIGIGLNVNQRVFHSNAPNPVSLWQILGREVDRQRLLHELLDSLQQHLSRLYQGERTAFREAYHQALYRREGEHPYSDAAGAFSARIDHVADDGRLILIDSQGRERSYAFGEVKMIV